MLCYSCQYTMHWLDCISRENKERILYVFIHIYCILTPVFLETAKCHPKSYSCLLFLLKMIGWILSWWKLAWLHWFQRPPTEDLARCFTWYSHHILAFAEGSRVSVTTNPIREHLDQAKKQCKTRDNRDTAERDFTGTGSMCKDQALAPRWGMTSFVVFFSGSYHQPQNSPLYGLRRLKKVHPHTPLVSLYMKYPEGKERACS